MVLRDYEKGVLKLHEDTLLKGFKTRITAQKAIIEIQEFYRVLYLLDILSKTEFDNKMKNVDRLANKAENE